jgi:hypothetical protein
MVASAKGARGHGNSLLQHYNVRAIPIAKFQNT